MGNGPFSTRQPYSGIPEATGVPSKTIDVRNTGAYDEALLVNANSVGSLHNNRNVINLILHLFFNDRNATYSSTNEISLSGNLNGEPRAGPRDESAVDQETTPVSPSADTDPAGNPSQPPATSARGNQLEEFIKGYLDDITAKSGEIEKIYDGLLSQNNIAAKGVKNKYVKCFKIIEKDINEQKIRFGVTNQSLLKALSNASLEEAACNTVLYNQVLDLLGSILQVLEDAPQHFTKIFSDFKERNTLERERQKKARRPDSESKAVLINIQGLLDSFDGLARPLIEDLPIKQSEREPQVSPSELQRLSMEGLAVATLFECLCRACPAKDHRSHTAYLSLKSENLASPETEYYMAIQSRIRGEKGLIWLRVVSIVSEVNQNSAHDSERPSDPVFPEIHLKPGTVSRKRQLSSDAALPPSKTSRTDTGHGTRRKTDPAIYGLAHIQVCPEYLAQHEGSNLLAMQMGDVSSVYHRIYFLPAEKRPLEKCEPISLANMLLERKKPEMALMRGRKLDGLLWVVSVARLIAEAVLRLNWLDSSWQWGKENVIFYTSQNATHDLEPFLKVKIESQEQGTSAIDDRPTTSGRSRTLLNLGFILLQLGLFKPIEASPDILSEERCRAFILSQIESNDIRTLGNYLKIVRCCATFPVGREKNEMNEQDFSEIFYQHIVFPLKGMEAELLSVRKGMFSTGN